MKKIYKLEDLDCAVCAQKMEDEIKKIVGIIEVSINFMSQKMILEFDDNVDIDLIMNKIVKICRSIEPDCIIKR